MGDTPACLTYLNCSMYEALEQCAQQYPGHTAFLFMGDRKSVV